MTKLHKRYVLHSWKTDEALERNPNSGNLRWVQGLTNLTLFNSDAAASLAYEIYLASAFEFEDKNKPFSVDMYVYDFHGLLDKPSEKTFIRSLESSSLIGSKIAGYFMRYARKHITEIFNVKMDGKKLFLLMNGRKDINQFKYLLIGSDNFPSGKKIDDGSYFRQGNCRTHGRCMVVKTEEQVMMARLRFDVTNIISIEEFYVPAVSG